MSRGCGQAYSPGQWPRPLFTIATFYVNSWPGTPPPAIYLISPALVLVSYLAVGMVAWRCYPTERVGLLFTVVGYSWFLPSLTKLHDPLPFTMGNLTSDRLPGGADPPCACLAIREAAVPVPTWCGDLGLRVERRQQRGGDVVLEPAHQRMWQCLPGQPADGGWVEPVALGDHNGHVDHRDRHHRAGGGPDRAELAELRGAMSGAR